MVLFSPKKQAEIKWKQQPACRDGKFLGSVLMKAILLIKQTKSWRNKKSKSLFLFIRIKRILVCFGTEKCWTMYWTEAFTRWFMPKGKFYDSFLLLNQYKVKGIFTEGTKWFEVPGIKNAFTLKLFWNNVRKIQF